MRRALPVGTLAGMTRDDSILDDEAAWQAVQRRDPEFDGRFVTGVHSTGIYCRPSCGAKTPSRKNVRFYRDGAAAREAGLRPCKRCTPDDVARDRQAVALVLPRLKAAGAPIALADLASGVGYSPGHFQRIFKRQVGLSPAAYGRALRMQRVDGALDGTDSVTGALYAAGFQSSSRFYEQAEGRMGMAPSVWNDGGKGATLYWAVVGTSLGDMLVAASEKGVCRLSFDEGVEDLRRRFPKADLVEGGAPFNGLLQQVIDAVEMPGAAYAHIPLDVRGTAFQEACWKALRAIPPGETRSYADIATAAGNAKAVRAAGAANARNHVAVLIPCHRVIRSDGSLGGYAYGLEIKRRLLEKERG